MLFRDREQGLPGKQARQSPVQRLIAQAFAALDEGACRRDQKLLKNFRQHHDDLDPLLQDD